MVERFFEESPHGPRAWRAGQVVGFGNFRPAREEAASGPQPQDGEESRSPRAGVVTFRPGQKLKAEGLKAYAGSQHQ